MALIFSPLTDDALEGPYTPIPKGVFLMLQLGEGISKLEAEMTNIIESVLLNRKFKTVKASTKKGQKDYLEKIIQLIRGCGFGTAVFSEYTPAPTLANIFFEIALCNLLGKPVIIVKSENAKAPSDFVRTEWISYITGNSKQLRTDFSHSITSIIELSKYYAKLGKIAMEAEDIDLELAFERYKQAFLINGKSSIKRRILDLSKMIKENNNPASELKPVRLRLRKAIIEFCNLIPNK